MSQPERTPGSPGAPRRHNCGGTCQRCTNKWRQQPAVHRPSPATRRPPEKRGRRGRPLIAQIPGLADWLEEQFLEVPRPSFKEIEERLKKTEFWPKIQAAGYQTGKTSIYSHWVKWNAQLARKRVIAEYAAAFNEAGEDGDILSIETAITGLANVTIFDALEKEVSGEESPGLSDRAAGLIDLHRKLQTSSARREAERRAARIGERRACAKLRQLLVAALKDHPDTLDIVVAAIESAEQEMENSN